MPQRRTVGGFSLAGVAVGGVVLAHWLAYVLAIPAGHVRAEVLAASGHSYWVLAIKLAVVLGLAAFGTLFLQHVGGRSRGTEPEEEPFSLIAARLSLLQVAAFTAMEVTERLMVGAPVAHMFHHRIFLMGLALQLIVAGAGALLLVWFSRTAERVAEALGRPRLRRPMFLRTIPVEIQTVSPLDPVRDGVGLRGPPGS
ncbi:MAG TPA: hypothetical protein VEN95_07870 [Actinomycetota bacterium]|jgi:hypothetical protein|nr:hypothetical protein [Actinomycetota bacterium]